MAENFIDEQHDITEKSKIKKFYESNKILIFSSILILIILFGFSFVYLEKKNQKRILLSENYIQAKFYLSKGNKNEALNLLKEITLANDSTYSALSFFLIIDQNLINDFKEISNLYDHLIENNKFDQEMKNLLIYKKALFNSNYVDESELLANTKPLLQDDTLWKPHALMLLGDYFLSKGEKIKSIEFYQQILSIKNLHTTMYEKAKSKLSSIAND